MEQRRTQDEKKKNSDFSCFSSFVEEFSCKKFSKQNISYFLIQTKRRKQESEREGMREHE